MIMTAIIIQTALTTQTAITRQAQAEKHAKQQKQYAMTPLIMMVMARQTALTRLIALFTHVRMDAVAQQRTHTTARLTAAATATKDGIIL